MMRDIFLKSSVYSCAYQLLAQPWLYESNAEFYFDPLCSYEPAMGSWALCISANMNDLTNTTYPDQHSLEHAIRHMNKMCAKDPSNDFMMTPNRYDDIWKNASSYIPNNEETHRDICYPVSLDDDQRRSSLNGLRVYYANLDASNNATLYLFIYLGIIFALGTLFGIRSIRTKILSAPYISQIRGRWTLPAISEKHAQTSEIFSGLIPTRLELCVLVGYILVHALAMTLHYEINNDAKLEPVYMQRLRSLSDRLGILSFAQLPLIVLFSGRNSLVENLSGLRYTTSIVLHKWISRVMLTDAFAHAVIYYIRAKKSGTLELFDREDFWQFGIIALWCCILLTVGSLGWFRRNYYESFLIIHIILALMFFYGLWVHVRRFGWTQWIWWSVGLWIAEKVVRGIRIIKFGGIVTAKAEVISLDTIRLTIPKRHNKKNKRWKPGQYGFIYILLPQVFWQSHPFTVMDLGTDLLVVIKAKQGVTQRLLNHLCSKGQEKISLMVEGPYGESCELLHYDTQLLLCGGSGIPGPLSYVLQYELPRTLLIIVCRDGTLLEAFKPQILAASLKTEMQIYVTRGTQSEQSALGLPIFYRRPNLTELVGSNANYDGSLAVLTCGPSIFVDEARGIVSNYLRYRPQKAIEYVEEYQIW